jgi:hypothetical protein
MLEIFSSDHPQLNYCEGCDIFVVVAAADVGANKAVPILHT